MMYHRISYLLSLGNTHEEDAISNCFEFYLISLYWHTNSVCVSTVP